VEFKLVIVGVQQCLRLKKDTWKNTSQKTLQTWMISDCIFCFLVQNWSCLLGSSEKFVNVRCAIPFSTIWREAMWLGLFQ